MSIGGNLRTMPFPDLLQWISQSRKTGTLVVDGPRISKKIYFRDGRVLGAASEDPREFLSYYLVGWGIVEERELEELLDMQSRHRVLLGELLIIIGRLSREELARILAMKTQESIFDLFLWKEGEFRFLDNILPSHRFQPLDLSVDFLVMEGVRRQDELERIRAVIPDPAWVPRVVGPVDEEELDAASKKVLQQVDGERSLEKVALAARVGLFKVMSAVFEGLRRGFLALDPPSGAEEPIPGFSRSSWRVLLRTGTGELERGRLLEAYEQVKALRAKYADHREIQELAGALEKRIRSAVEKKAPPDTAVLELAVPQDDPGTASLTPREAFLVSRLNGRYTLREVLSLLPEPELEGRVLVQALIDRGIVRPLLPGDDAPAPAHRE